MFSNVRTRSFQSCRLLLYTSPLFNAEHFCTKPLLEPSKVSLKSLRKSVTLDKSHYRLIYKFTYISFLGGFMKSKISIPIASVSIAPFLYFFDKTHISPFILILSGGVYYAMGRVLSKVTANIVGKMYVNKEDEITEVMMSSVDEYGRRIDRIHKLEDLINIDYPNKISRSLGFIAIGVENSNLYYKINTRTCKFIDEKACDQVFGFTWSSNINETSESKSKEEVEEDTDKRLPEK